MNFTFMILFFFLISLGILLLFIIRYFRDKWKPTVLIVLLFFLFLSVFFRDEIKYSIPFQKSLIAFHHWTHYSTAKVKESVLLDSPLIPQLPELPRGCEVTSLAMLLQSAGVSVDKMELAKEVKKNPATYLVENGLIFFGDPDNGFVGDMYTLSKPGLGVYHKPILELANKYLPEGKKALDLTGADFEELKVHLSDGRPVWVIINTTYNKLPDSAFQTWHTESGKIKITYKEHSVLVTGYDDQYVYFNDPLTNVKNQKAPIDSFEKAWVQMGRQAITYLP
ncbi:C39 family peptidase [Bacillus sp. FSL W8-0116]|uniref:C39 family peptidase n=1 Tax=Bacillus sp. FSL W8-0116 TaxID=2978206 RepID=UPI0030F7137B